jgi:hypothetical protein
MNEHGNDHGHDEDPFVCIKVGGFFIAVLAMIILVGILQ